MLMIKISIFLRHVRLVVVEEIIWNRQMVFFVGSSYKIMMTC